MQTPATFFHPGKFSSKPRTISSIPDLPVERFDHRNGLTSLQVHITTISEDGRLWAATPAGLACYDGVQTQMFDRKHGLANHGLRTLALHPQSGELWIGTDIGIEILNISEGIPRSIWSNALGTVNSLGLQEEQALIGCSHGLFLIGADRKVRSIAGFSSAQDTIEKVLAHSDGAFWIIGSEHGLAKVSASGSFIEIGQNYNVLEKPAVLANGPQDTIYVGGKNGYIQLEKCGRILTHQRMSSPVEAIHWTRNQLWLAYDQCVVSLTENRSESLATKTGLKKVVVKHIMADRFDNIWLSTSGQALLKVSSFRNTFVEDFPTDTGHILSIYNDQDGILIGGSTGLAMPNGEMILKNLEVWDVLRDNENKIWSATDKGLFCTPNPNLSFSYVKPDCPIIQAPCRALIHFQNRLYVASIRGLARLDTEGAVEILDCDGKSFGYVYSLHIGPDQALWIATLGKGVFRYNGTELQSVHFPQLAETANVYAITHDQAGRIYIAHDNMVTRIDASGNGEVLYQSESAVAAWTLGWMQGGFLIVGSSDGLIFLNDETGEVRHWISGNFEDVPWEFTTSRSLAIVGDAVYCGLGSGLRTVKVNDLIPGNEAPIARLSNMAWRGAEIVSNGQAVIFGNWHLKIELSTEWFLDICQMRYRLNGFDEDWSDYQSLGPIHFTSLPLGHYSLDVELRSPLVGRGVATKIVSFDVLPEKMA